MFYFLIVLSKECALLHVKRGREREREKKVDFGGFSLQKIQFPRLPYRKRIKKMMLNNIFCATIQFSQ